MYLPLMILKGPDVQDRRGPFRAACWNIHCDVAARHWSLAYYHPCGFDQTPR